ncbi:hypothetical protein [Streptomyces niveus]|uniref:hypothetical protein n=1 Tax=Streptomyces niveus TaxID=193462 RepID=UPI003429C29C
MTTDLSTLDAADRWDGMAKELHKQEVAYKRDVHSTATRETWQGLSADAAAERFHVTLKEFQKAQVEAKAVASLLRDARTQFVGLRKKLESIREDAVAAGMKVSDKGLVSHDREKLGYGSRDSLAPAPEYLESVRKAVNSWQQSIDQLVKDVGEADKGVEIALQGVVIDSDMTDGTFNGFNGNAHGDTEKYGADAAAQARTKTDGWTGEGKVTATGPDVGAVAIGPKYGKEGTLKAYADLFHVTAEGSRTNGNLTLSGIADGYGGARATANYGLTDQGVVGKAEASAGARGLAEGRAEYGHVGAYGRGEGFAGAEAGVAAKVGKDEVSVGGKAFAGAKGSAAGGVEVAGIGIGGTGEAWAGPGAEAKFGFERDEDGTFKLGGKVGASPILGGAVGIEIAVDPGKVADAAGDAANAVGDAAGAVGDAAGSVKDTVTGWF